MRSVVEFEARLIERLKTVPVPCDLVDVADEGALDVLAPSHLEALRGQGIVLVVRTLEE